MTDPWDTSERDNELILELGRLRQDDERRAFVRQRPEVQRPEFVRKLSEGVVRTVREDVRIAEALGDAALFISNELEDDSCRALSLRAKANTLYICGDYQAAIDSYQESRKLFAGLGEAIEVGRTGIASIQAHILLGKYDLAFEIAERASEIFRAAGEERLLARLEINVGNIYHRQDRFEEALSHYRQAYQQLLPLGDGEAVAAALSNMMVCLTMLNDFTEALRSYREARRVCQANGFEKLVAQADYNIAYLYYLRGEYSRSLELLLAAREGFEEVGDSYHVGLCDLDRAEIYLELNLSDDAATLALRAEAFFEKLGTGYELAKSIADQAIALSHKGHFHRALKLFEKAHRLFLREKNQTWPGVIDLYRALVLFEEGRIFEARRLASDALECFRKMGLRSKAILCQLLLARSSLRTGDLVGARRQCDQALAELTTLDAPLARYQANFLMGRIEEMSGDPRCAYDSFQTARKELELLRSSLHGEDLKIAFMKNKLAVYESLVELCLDEEELPGKRDEAFNYIEHAKSRGLIDLILSPGQKGSLRPSGQSKLARHVHSLREELNWYYHRIEQEEMKSEDRSPSRIDALQAQTFERETELLSALRDLPASDAPYGRLKSGSPRSLASIQTTLSEDSTLVEYFFVRERILACVLTRDSIQILPLSIVERTKDLLQRLQFQLSKFKLRRDYVEAFEKSLFGATQAHLRELEKDLVAPIRHLLLTSHLVVVPHGFLHYLPFHALFDGKRYLLDDFTLSYAPSASIYAHCHEASFRGGNKALVLAVPDESTSHVLEEARSVAATLVESTLLLGKEASLAALQGLDRETRILHIASHGYFRQDNPMFSAIRLGDSFLNLYDLYQLELPVELVTLSACATGLSVVVGGDELLGLVRGLLYAGAHSALVTLWDVQDRTTSDVMRSFYTHLEQQGGAANAAQSLRQAVLELRERHPHPYFWAPYLLVGKSFRAQGA